MIYIFFQKYSAVITEAAFTHVDNGNLPGLQKIFSSLSPGKSAKLLNAINSKTGGCLLHHATVKGHTEIVKWLIEIKHESVEKTMNYYDQNDRMVYTLSPLYIAANRGHLETASYLLKEAHADPNYQEPKCAATPLHRACLRNDLQMITLLLLSGGDIYAPAITGTRPIDLITCQEIIPHIEEAITQAGPSYVC